VNWPVRPQFTAGGAPAVAGLAFEWDNSAFVCPGCGESFLFRRMGKVKLVHIGYKGAGPVVIDLVVPHRDGGQSYVYLAAPKASFSDTRRTAFGPRDAHIRMAEAADFDGDGLTDIVAIDERTGVSLYFGQRGGTFSSGISVGDPKIVPYALTIGDLNGDGKIDIVVGHVEAPSTVYFNRGSRQGFTAVNFGDNKGTVYGFALGDFDEDGLPDIAVARSEAPNIVYFATRAAQKAP
jgi:hypothetical protein